MRLDHIGEGRIAIIGPAGARVELSGAAALRVATWHAHMRTHGEDWAATYLAGVAHGLDAAAAMRVERVLADAQQRIAEGRALVESTRARHERGTDAEG